MSKTKDRLDILDKAEKLISQAETLIPKILEPDLPPAKISDKDISGNPAWHDFEHKIWSTGEELRALIQKNPALRKDAKLFQRILNIAKNRNAKRGRQSFIMLLASKQFSNFAADLVTQLDDKFVDGQVICAIQKMRVSGFENEIKPFTENEHAWIRNAAKKYLTQKNETLYEEGFNKFCLFR